MYSTTRLGQLYIISSIVHGKWEKTGSFRILANYSDAKFVKRYPGYAIGSETLRPELSENVVVFVAIIF